TLDGSGTKGRAGGTSDFDPDDYSSTVGGAVVPQAPEADGYIHVASSLYIFAVDPDENPLPKAWVNDPYLLDDGDPEDPDDDTYVILEAYGGTPDYKLPGDDLNDPSDDIWKYSGWSGDLPDGLILNSDGSISGTPAYDNITYPHTYTFTVELTDSGDPTQTARRDFEIEIDCAIHTITATAGEGGVLYLDGDGEGGKIVLAGDIPVIHRQGEVFIISQKNPCYDWEVTVDGVSQSQVNSYTFTNVTGNHTIHAEFTRRTYTIMAEAGEWIGADEFIYSTGSGNGGSIVDAGPVPAVCGFNKPFTITVTLPCYELEGVYLDGQKIALGPAGPASEYVFLQDIGNPNVYTCTLLSVQGPHDLKALFNLILYTIESSATEGGIISPTPDVTVYCGSNQTFDIEANDGYQLMYILMDGQLVDLENLNPNVYEFTEDPENPGAYRFTFLNVMGNHTIHAAFGWVRRYNNDIVNGDDEASAVAADSDGNIHVTGFSLGRTTGPDYFTISYDGEGNALMSSRYDGPAHEGDKATAIVVDSEGNRYVTGSSFRGTPQKHADYDTVKFDSLGNEVWNTRYDARRNGEDKATAVTLDELGNFVYITGRSQDSESKKSDVLHYDYYTIKYDTNRGRVQWEARYDNSIGGHDEAADIAVDASGYVYVTGTSQGDGTGLDFATIKYGPDGKLDPTWGGGIARYHGEQGADMAVALALDSSGDVYVSGSSWNGSSYDIITVKYGSDGNPDTSWGTGGTARFDGGNVNYKATAMAVDVSGNVYVTGYRSSGADESDYVTVKFDANGDLDATRGTGGVASYDSGNGVDKAVALALDSLGNVYITGQSKGIGTDFDFYTIKYGISGNVIWSARYNNDPVDGIDEPAAIAVFEDSSEYVHVYVIGKSQGAETGFDFAIIKYGQ
ncbi:SBBP repeat-containing protein, partial [bacterium]|nr:SBBP repeat-containing protein [bacterium]